jgi:hypothetical protein
MSEKDYEDAKIHLGNFLSEKLVAGLLGFDLGTVIADEARTAIKEKVQGSLLAMMVNDKNYNSNNRTAREKGKGIYRKSRS